MKNQFLQHMNLLQENEEKLAIELNRLLPIELSDLIEKKPLEEQVLIFRLLSPDHAVRGFEYLTQRTQEKILEEIPSQDAALLLNSLSPDDRTAFLQQLPKDRLNQLLKYLSPEERTLTVKLLGYPENSVGRMMTPDYIAIKMDWTIQQTLDYIRVRGRNSETINVIYAVDDRGVLLDDFHIRQFLITPLEKKVRDLSDGKYVTLNVEDDAEKAINTFRKYARVALPVIDSNGVLLGIVTIDDILQIASKEDTKDMQKIGGVEALAEPYMATPFFDLMRKRAGWLTLLFLGELLTASAMGFFQGEIERAVVLALFVPLIISSGGNSGSQSSTLIVRALALGEVSWRDWAKIFRREILSGLFLGALLGTIGFLRITVWSTFSSIYGAHWILLAFTIFFSLIGVVLWGTLMGAMLPLILRYWGFDPATSSAPFVATLVDVTGLIIYFSIAMFFLSGTLL